MMETMFERTPDYFNFLSFLFREKLKFGFGFTTDFLVFERWKVANDGGVYNTLTDNHYHVLAQCFGKSDKGQPKSRLLPCLYTTYALLKTTSG